VVESHGFHVSITVWYAAGVSEEEVILILANKEGGAHVDENEDPDYRRLMTDAPLSFAVSGVRLETPDLAKFLARNRVWKCWIA
jgi:hypothetical protein